jgi:hypothetical protein
MTCEFAMQTDGGGFLGSDALGITTTATLPKPQRSSPGGLAF